MVRNRASHGILASKKRCKLGIYSALARITAPAHRLAGPKAWHWAVFLIVVAGLTLLVLPAIFKWQRSRRQKVVHLELVNRGNVRSRYALHASEPSGNLGFHFLLNGMPLLEQTVTIGTASPVQKPAPATKTGTPQSKNVQKTSNVQRTLSQTTQTGGLIANLLSTVGRLLPTSLGKPLLDMSADMRKGQQLASRARQASQYAGQLQSKGTRASRHPASVTTTAPVIVPTVVETWAHTQFVEPNQKTSIELSILPDKPYQHGYFTYTVKSRSVEFKEAPETLEAYTLQLEPLNPFDRYAPFLGYAICLIILLILFLSLW